MNARVLAPVSPGELLWEEFMAPVSLSQSELADRIGLPVSALAGLVAGGRAVDADVDRWLSRFFGLSEGYWLRAQAAYDAEVAGRVTR